MLTEHKGKEDFFVEFFDTCKRIYMMVLMSVYDRIFYENKIYIFSWQ